MAKAKLCFFKGARATAVGHPNNNRKIYFYIFNYVFMILKYIILKHTYFIGMYFNRLL